MVLIEYFERFNIKAVDHSGCSAMFFQNIHHLDPGHCHQQGIFTMQSCRSGNITVSGFFTGFLFFCGASGFPRVIQGLISISAHPFTLPLRVS